MGAGASRPNIREKGYSEDQIDEYQANTPKDSPIPISGPSQSSAIRYISFEDVIGGENSTSKYIRRKLIGQGAYGEAMIVQRNPAYDPAAHPGLEMQRFNLSRETIPGMLYVAKISDLTQMRSQYRQYAQTEFICLAHSRHFAIIKFFEHFILDKDNEQMIIIMELANHGDLHHNLMSSGIDNHGVPIQALRLTEREAGTYFVQILLALNHVHRRRMIHRDVKSANLFLTSNGIIKLGDFGFSQKYESTVSSESVAGTFLGTPYYLSPEMWSGMRYGKRADVWAAGVVLYEMLMDGQRAFDANGLGELRSKVLSESVVLPAQPPEVPGLQRGAFSAEMRELVYSIFNKNPKARPSTEDLLATPLMQHYLYIFEKHVHHLLQADDALKASNPDTYLSTQLNFPDPEDRNLVLQGLEEAKNIVMDLQKETVVPVMCEGIVYKDNQNGIWKERYLTLSDNLLVISLSQGKFAASGSERTKAVPVDMIISCAPCTINAPYGEESNNFLPPYGFAIAMKSMRTIVFGLATLEERNKWLTAVMKVLEID